MEEAERKGRQWGNYSWYTRESIKNDLISSEIRDGPALGITRKQRYPRGDNDSIEIWGKFACVSSRFVWVAKKACKRNEKEVIGNDILSPINRMQPGKSIEQCTQNFSRMLENAGTEESRVVLPLSSSLSFRSVYCYRRRIIARYLSLQGHFDGSLETLKIDSNRQKEEELGGGGWWNRDRLSKWGFV